MRSIKSQKKSISKTTFYTFACLLTHKIMKRYFKVLALSVFAFLFFISACKKEESDPTPESMLTAGNWKMTAMVIDPPVTVQGISVSDIYAFLLPCVTDDLIKFESDGTVVEDEGATKCDPDDPQTTSDGTWTLSSDGTVLTITYPEGIEVATVKSLTSNTLILESEESIDFGEGFETYNATITMSLQ